MAGKSELWQRFHLDSSHPDHMPGSRDDVAPASIEESDSFNNTKLTAFLSESLAMLDHHRYNNRSYGARSCSGRVLASKL